MAHGEKSHHHRSKGEAINVQRKWRYRSVHFQRLYNKVINSPRDVEMITEKSAAMNRQVLPNYTAQRVINGGDVKNSTQVLKRHLQYAIVFRMGRDRRSDHSTCISDTFLHVLYIQTIIISLVSTIRQMSEKLYETKTAITIFTVSPCILIH